ncbi:MAG: 4Fe-4S binding protein [Intestinibacter bartlettii]
MRKFVTPVGNEGMYILDTASWRIVKPVMNKEKCVECGICLTYCPVNSIEFKSDKYIINYDFAKDVEFVQMNVQKLQSI